MSSIHYKFRATFDLKTVRFDGLHILGSDLKREIYAKENIKAESFDLVLQNSHTKRTYNNDEMVPRNATIIVQRVPKEGAEKLPKIPLGNGGLILKGVGTSSDAVLNPDVVGHLDETELEKMTEEERRAHMMTVSTSKYHSSNFQKRTKNIMVGAPPPTYVCNRCNMTGHWYNNCPMANTRRTTGLPSQELMETTSDDPHAMLHPSGKYVVPIMHWKARQHKKGFGAGPSEIGSSSPAERSVPSRLLCPICNELLKDAMLTTCCGESFCADCITEELLATDERKCPKCGRKDLSPLNNVVPNKAIRDAVSEWVSTSSLRGPDSASASPNIDEPVNTTRRLRIGLNPALVPPVQQIVPVVADDSGTVNTATTVVAHSVPDAVSASSGVTPSEGSISPCRALPPSTLQPAVLTSGVVAVHPPVQVSTASLVPNYPPPGLGSVPMQQGPTSSQTLVPPGVDPTSHLQQHTAAIRTTLVVPQVSNTESLAPPGTVPVNANIPPVHVPPPSLLATQPVVSGVSHLVQRSVLPPMPTGMYSVNLHSASFAVPGGPVPMGFSSGQNEMDKWNQFLLRKDLERSTKARGREREREKRKHRKRSESTDLSESSSEASSRERRREKKHEKERRKKKEERRALRDRVVSSSHKGKRPERRDYVAGRREDKFDKRERIEKREKRIDVEEERRKRGRDMDREPDREVPFAERKRKKEVSRRVENEGEPEGISRPSSREGEDDEEAIDKQLREAEEYRKAEQDMELNDHEEISLDVEDMSPVRVEDIFSDVDKDDGEDDERMINGALEKELEGADEEDRKEDLKPHTSVLHSGKWKPVDTAPSVGLQSAEEEENGPEPGEQKDRLKKSVDDEGTKVEPVAGQEAELVDGGKKKKKKKKHKKEKKHKRDKLRDRDASDGDEPPKKPRSASAELKTPEKEHERRMDKPTKPFFTSMPESRSRKDSDEKRDDKKKAEREKEKERERERERDQEKRRREKEKKDERERKEREEKRMARERQERRERDEKKERERQRQEERCREHEREKRSRKVLNEMDLILQKRKDDERRKEERREEEDGRNRKERNREDVTRNQVTKDEKRSQRREGERKRKSDVADRKEDTDEGLPAKAAKVQLERISSTESGDLVPRRIDSEDAKKEASGPSAREEETESPDDADCATKEEDTENTIKGVREKKEKGSPKKKDARAAPKVSSGIGLRTLREMKAEKEREKARAAAADKYKKKVEDEGEEEEGNRKGTRSETDKVFDTTHSKNKPTGVRIQITWDLDKK